MGVQGAAEGGRVGELSPRTLSGFVHSFIHSLTYSPIYSSFLSTSIYRALNMGQLLGTQS